MKHSLWAAPFALVSAGCGGLMSSPVDDNLAGSGGTPIVDAAIEAATPPTPTTRMPLKLQGLALAQDATSLYVSTHSDDTAASPYGELWKVAKGTFAATRLSDSVDNATALAVAGGLVAWTGDNGISVWFGGTIGIRTVAPGSAANSGIVTDGAAFYAAVPEINASDALRIPIADLSSTSAPSFGVINASWTYAALAISGANLVGAAAIADGAEVQMIPTSGALIAPSLGIPMLYGSAPIPNGLAADDDTIFLLSGNIVAKVANITTPKSALYFASRTLTSLAIDARSVYVTEQGAHGRVLAVSRTDGSARVLAGDEASPHSILVDDTQVYWLADGALRGAAKE
ncbi:MAG: hypothetical protein ACHREM_11420 [Polyangiales bacterium]